MNVPIIFFILPYIYAVLRYSLGVLPVCALKKADEVLRIFKAESLAYLRDAEGFICKQLAGSRKQSVVYHTLGGSASLGLDEFTEIFGRIAAFVGKVGLR